MISNLNQPEKRVLVIDDQKVVHKGFKRILQKDIRGDSREYDFQVDSAYQGEEGVEMIKKANDEGRPYQVVFVDMRMPPGWNGINTMEHIFQVDSQIQLVICTAYSDYPAKEIDETVGDSDRLLFLKKPFDANEVLQMTKTLYRKWVLNFEASKRLADLQESKGGVLNSANIKEMNELKETVKKVQNADMAKTEFLANISHELRTPMHGIISFANYGIEDSKRKDIGREELEKDFEEIRDSSVRLLRILNDILDLSKLEAGKVDYMMDEDDIVVSIDTVFSEFALLANEKNLKFEIDCGDGDTNAYFDSTRIIQVLRNIISNAIKFSHNDRKIVVQVENIMFQEHDFLRVSILNYGEGISPAELTTIFDKFVQSRKLHPGNMGTGLGLPICKQIIEGHHGNIWAENGANGETSFIFTIPKHKSVMEERAAQKAS